MKEQPKQILYSEDGEEEQNKPHAGRPLMFKTAEELEKKIDDYFASCYEEQWVDEERRDEETGELIRNEKSGTAKLFPIRKMVQIKHFKITDLALFLNTTRETLMEYSERDGFVDTIKKAKTMIESAYEDRLINRGNGGDIFALKNFNWKDQSSIALGQDEKMETLTINIVRTNANQSDDEGDNSIGQEPSSNEQNSN